MCYEVIECIAHPVCKLAVVSCQADLTAAIQIEGGKLTERQAVQKVAQPCVTALADLHAKGIAHGALLPHNILFKASEPICELAGEQSRDSHLAKCSIRI